jgi:hypothetical protein
MNILSYSVSVNNYIIIPNNSTEAKKTIQELIKQHIQLIDIKICHIKHKNLKGLIKQYNQAIMNIYRQCIPTTIDALGQMIMHIKQIYYQISMCQIPKNYTEDHLLIESVRKIVCDDIFESCNSLEKFYYYLKIYYTSDSVFDKDFLKINFDNEKFFIHQIIIPKSTEVLEPAIVAKLTTLTSSSKSNTKEKMLYLLVIILILVGCTNIYYMYK